MSSYLWKIYAVKKGQGGIAKGMEAHVVVSGGSRKPTNKEISDAFNRKYGINCHPSAINNFIELKKG